MHAHVGDEIVIAGHEIGQAKRVGEIVEVRRSDGGPPYGVRWDDTGRTTLLFPGNDSTIKHLRMMQCGSPEDVAS